MEETNSDVDEGPETAPDNPAAANGAGSASSFYDPERPPFEERPVQSVQDRVPATAAAASVDDQFDLHQAIQDRKRMGAVLAAAVVALLLLRRRRRRSRRA